MTIDLDSYREQSRATWDRMAPGWADRREWMQKVAGRVNDWLCARVDPQPGQTILDVAAGPGDLGFDVAERVGPEGRVISTDFAPEMVELAQRIGESRGATNVDHLVLDAEQMELESDSVDGAVCRWGYMLMADPAAALAETRRVLRDGGRLSFAVWTRPDGNLWAAIPALTLVERGHMPPPRPGAPGIFALADPDRIRQLVTDAGFAEPVVEEVGFDFHYADDDDVWDSITRLAGPLAQAIAGLDDDEQAATRAAIIEKLSGFRRGDGSYWTPAATWGVVAG